MSLMVQCVTCKQFYSKDKTKKYSYTEINTSIKKIVYACNECCEIILKISKKNKQKDKKNELFLLR